MTWHSVHIMYFTPWTPSWVFGFWISELDCFNFWFLCITLTFSYSDNPRTTYSDKLASWRPANRTKTPHLLCWYRWFLSVTKLVALKKKPKFSLEGTFYFIFSCCWRFPFSLTMFMNTQVGSSMPLVTVEEPCEGIQGLCFSDNSNCGVSCCHLSTSLHAKPTDASL